MCNHADTQKRERSAIADLSLLELNIDLYF